MRPASRIHSGLGGLLLATVALSSGIACARDGPARVSKDRAVATGVTPGNELSQMLARADLLFVRSGDSADAIWRMALHLADSLGDTVARARALTGRAFVARRRMEYPRARQLGEEALALKLRLGMRDELSRSYNGLGLLAWDEGRTVDALRLYDRAADAARATGDSTGLAKALINTGLALLDLGDFTQARASLDRGRALAQFAGDTVSLGRAITNLAALDIILGDALSALATLEVARRLMRATGDVLGEVNAIGQLATAYDMLGEPRRAFAAIDTAITLAHRDTLRKEEAEDLKLLGDFYEGAGDHTRALESYARATIATDTIGLLEERGNLLRNQASIQLAMGRTDAAERLASEALRLHRDGGFPRAELSDALLLAEVALARGERAQSDAYLRSSRRIASRLGIPALQAGVVLADARIADRVGDWPRVIRTLAESRGSLQLAGEAAVAEASALRLRAYARLGQLDAASAAGRQAVATIERLRGNYGSGELRTSYASARAGVYADLALVLLRQGRNADAFEVSDAARGRALLDHLATARAEVASSRGTAGRFLDADRLLRSLDTLVARLRDLEQKPPRERGASTVAITRELSERVANARTQYETLVASLAEQGDVLVLLGSGRRTAAEVQTSLAEGEALLEYFVTPDRLVIFVLRRDGLTTVSNDIGATELMSRTRLARDLMGRANSGGREVPVLKELHALLLGPVVKAGALRGIRRLIVARHSALTYLPFAALIDPLTGRYLVQDVSLMYVPSAAALQVLRLSRPVASSSTAASPIAFAPFPDRLRATGGEARSFTRAVSGGRMVVGGAATEQRVRMALESGAIVHVASHAMMNSRNPLFSRIELAPIDGGNTSDNGRLEVHELLGLRVNSPLVFLSGCETGVGDAWSTAFQPGEDYTTLAQALLYAGAKSVIATLWRIDDVGAAELARQFYAGAERLPIPEALAQAQRGLLVNAALRSPYFWAAYEVYGGTTVRALAQTPQ